MTTVVHHSKERARVPRAGRTQNDLAGPGSPEQRVVLGKAARRHTPLAAHAECNQSGPPRDPLALLQAQDANRVVDLTLSSGERQRILYIAPASPRATQPPSAG